jgi:phosphotransferase system enzyme I (PtsI)
LRGFPAAPGIAVGPAFVFAVKAPHVPARTIAENQIESEKTRFAEALESTRFDLSELKERASEMIGDNLAKIFDAQILILSDPEIDSAVRAEIENKRAAAESAFDRVIQRTMTKLAASPDAYLRGMRQEIEAVRARVVNRLLGLPTLGLADLTQPSILVASVLTPADVVGLKKENILGIISEMGGQTSHTTLLAKSLQIPAVVGVGGAVGKIPNGTQIVVDGYSGSITITPDAETLELYNRRRRESIAPWSKKLAALRELPAVTVDGHKIELLVNIDMAAEAADVAVVGAEGVGLYRTEYLFLKQGRFPTENEQYKTYRQAAQTLAPRPLTIRTFDLGGDKYFDDSGDALEQNPALGWRAIRVSLQKKAPFKAQLRALMRAAVGTNIRVMFPMITSVEELSQARSLLDEACREVCTRGEEIGQVQVGVMIETPASVWIAESLAKMVDFFSVGTNDLTQYTLALDRNNPHVAHLFRPYHPAIIHAIARTLECARRNDVHSAVCGEIASEPHALPLFIGLGVDQLSVHHTVVPRAKAIIRELSFNEAQELARNILRMETATEVETTLNKFYKNHFGQRWR